MNLNMWKWFADQSQANKLWIVLAITASSLSGVLYKAFDRRGQVIKEQSKYNKELVKANIECEQKSGKEARDILEKQLNDEKERGRKSDSMYYAITAAKIAVKKASKNENQK